MEGLLQDLGGLLRLAVITSDAFLRCEAATQSGFGLAFLIGFRTNHSVLLRVASLPCCIQSSQAPDVCQAAPRQQCQGLL